MLMAMILSFVINCDYLNLMIIMTPNWGYRIIIAGNSRTIVNMMAMIILVYSEQEDLIRPNAHQGRRSQRPRIS